MLGSSPHSLEDKEQRALGLYIILTENQQDWNLVAISC